MKKLLAVALAAVSISTFAAWERVGALQVADMKAIKEAAVKVGQMFGNPIVAAGVESGLAEVPMFTFFGPMRPKSSMLFSLLVKSDVLAKEPEKAFDELEYAMLYPMSITKDAFVKLHEGAYETNGVVVVKGTLDGSNPDTDKTYVVFSKDGKWAGASDNPEHCTVVLRDAAVAEKSMDGEIARVMVDRSAFKAVGDLLSKQKDVAPDVLACVKALRSVVLGVKVSDLGIDLAAGLKMDDGSKLSKVGLKPLAADPFAFAGKSAFCAKNLQAEDCERMCMSGGDMTDGQWAALLPVCRKYGIDVAKFLTRASDGGKTLYTYDFGALFKFVQENEEKIGKIDAMALMGDIAAVCKDGKLGAQKRANAVAVSVKGFNPKRPIAERFAATLPEAAGGKPFCVGFFSVSSFLKSLVPHLVALIPEAQRKEMGPMLDALAVEFKCGIASAYSREGDEIKALTRISADEIRGIGGIANGVMSMGLMNAFGGGDEDQDDTQDTQAAPAADNAK